VLSAPWLPAALIAVVLALLAAAAAWRVRVMRRRWPAQGWFPLDLPAGAPWAVMPVHVAGFAWVVQLPAPAGGLYVADAGYALTQARAERAAGRAYRRACLTR
jgi:hypothetical protein